MFNIELISSTDLNQLFHYRISKLRVVLMAGCQTCSHSCKWDLTHDTHQKWVSGFYGFLRLNLMFFICTITIKGKCSFKLVVVGNKITKRVKVSG